MQLYCTSYLRKYKRGKYWNENRHIKTANGINLKNVFDLHRNVLEDIYYDQEITKKRFSQSYSLEMKKLKRGLKSENGEAK